MARIRFTTARDLFDAFPSALEDVEAEPSDEPSLDFLKALIAAGALEKAVAFCAYLLPRREAVWWGCLAMRTLMPHRAPKDDALLQTAETWVREPDEAQRQAALAAGSDGDRRSPATWVALAAGWSGGSIVPGESASVPAPHHLTARAVRAAILMAASRIDARQRTERVKSALEAGLRLAGGGA
jgi:hypothetical protein